MIKIKNTKRTLLATGAVAILLGVILLPNINATMLKGNAIEATAENQIAKEYELNKEIEEDEDYKPACYGCIYGTTGYFLGWGMYPLPYTLVEARIGGNLIGKDRSGLLTCNYRIRRLPLDQTYTVTASHGGILEHNGKYYRFVPKTETVTLTADNPNVRIDFYLETELTDPPNNYNANTQVNYPVTINS